MPQAKEGRGAVESAGSSEMKGRPSRPETGAQEDHTGRLRRLAHDKLDQLFQDAVSARFYGRVTVEVSFENGRPLIIHRRIEGVDK